MAVFHSFLWLSSIPVWCVCVSDIILLSIHLFIDRLLIVFHWDSGTSSQFNWVQLFSHVWLFAAPWTAVRYSSPSLTNSRSLLKLTLIESVMSSNHLILCCPLLPPSIFPSIRVSFKWLSSSPQAAKVLEFQLQHQSFQQTFRTDFL